MGGTQSVLLDEADAARLSASSGFTRMQLQRLYDRFVRLDSRGLGCLCPADLERIPELAINPLAGRIIAIFFPDFNGSINFTQFVQILSAFRPNSASDSCEQLQQLRQRELQFLFDFYDTNADGRISVDELSAVLLDLVGKEVELQQLRKIASDAIVGVAGAGAEHVNFDQFSQAFAKLGQERLLKISFLD